MALAAALVLLSALAVVLSALLAVPLVTLSRRPANCFAASV
jgi:hypothetical protein